MLLKALVDYAARCEDLAPRMYLEMPVKCFIDLDADGNYTNIVRASGSLDARKDRGLRVQAPHALRSASVRAKLLADNAEYVLGLARAKGGKSDKVQERHLAFKQEVRKCAGATKLPQVLAVDRFLTSLKLRDLNLPKDIDGTDNITFRVDGKRVIDLAEVRAYWAEAGAPTEGRVLRCLVCDHERLCLESLPVQIGGGAVPEGNSTGTALISANANAFESYGLERSLIAPVCLDCGEAFVKAINRLADDDSTHLRVGRTLFLFWTRDDCGFSPVGWFDRPNSEDVRELLESPHTSRKGSVNTLASEPFYAVALTANVARIAVRDWINTTVGEAEASLRRYFRLQHIDSGDPAQDGPLALWRLAGATARKGDDIPHGTAEALLLLALRGTPLPHRLLYQAVRRARVEGRVAREHATLIKMVLLSQDAQWNGGDDMVKLDFERRDPAYLCGRLLAVLEGLQDRAIGAKAGVVERFGGAASATPKTVFPQLLRTAWAHLAKLGKSTPGAYHRYEKEIQDVLSGLHDFPATLTLQEQGVFFLGYYHQCAHDRAQRIARKEAKNAEQAAAAAAQ